MDAAVFVEKKPRDMCTSIAWAVSDSWTLCHRVVASHESHHHLKVVKYLWADEQTDE